MEGLTRSRYYARQQQKNHQKKRDPYADSILQFLESEQLLQWVNTKADLCLFFKSHFPIQFHL